MLVHIAIQGDSLADKELPENTTIGELKAILDQNPTLEFRVSGEEVEDAYILQNDDLVIGTKDAKGGIV